MARRQHSRLFRSLSAHLEVEAPREAGSGSEATILQCLTSRSSIPVSIPEKFAGKPIVLDILAEDEEVAQSSRRRVPLNAH